MDVCYIQRPWRGAFGDRRRVTRPLTAVVPQPAGAARCEGPCFVCCLMGESGTEHATLASDSILPVTANQHVLQQI